MDSELRAIRKEIQIEFGPMTMEQFLKRIDISRSAFNRYELGIDKIPWRLCAVIKLQFGESYFDRVRRLMEEQ